MPELSESDARVSERFAIPCQAFASAHAASMLGDFKVKLEHAYNEHPPSEQRVLKPFQQRLDEYKQLVEEVQAAYGDESAKYLKSHISAIIEKHFNPGALAHHSIDQTLKGFYQDSLLLRVEECARAETGPQKQELTTAEVARQEFLKKGEDILEHVLFRVKEFEIHWVTPKRDIPPITTIDDRMHERMLVTKQEGIEFNG